jgi:uncharacterized protein with GYD domain
MPTFVSTVNFTQQGIRDIKATPKRVEGFKALAAEMGVTVKELYWTQGPFDGLIVFDAPNDETAAALMLRLGTFGNVTTQTARAFNASQIQKIVEKISD